jgi:hypothetical protein
MKDTVTIVSEAQITPVPVSVLDVVWPEVVGYIEDAAATTNGKYKAQDIYDDIQRGVYVLWIIVENDAIIGALTTRIAVYPNRRSMSLDWVGGSRLRRITTNISSGYGTSMLKITNAHTLKVMVVADGLENLKTMVGKRTT